jgi:hypothetical protein
VSVPIVIVTLVGLMTVCYPGGLSAAYADLRDAQALTDKVNRCREDDRQMSGTLSGIRDRMGYKEELVTALIHGQTDLSAVTDEFVELNRGNECVLRIQRSLYGNVGETELAARNVLDYCQQRVAADGGSSVVMSRLRVEYQKRFGHPAPPEL